MATDFEGMEDILGDFVLEAQEMLGTVDNGLIALETNTDSKELLNSIFRGFHTIKGGAGFLQADALVSVCHKTESLFDQLRSGKLEVTTMTMDVIMEATSRVREYLEIMQQGTKPPTGQDDELLADLDLILSGKAPELEKEVAAVVEAASAVAEIKSEATPEAKPTGGVDWAAMNAVVSGQTEKKARPATANAATDDFFSQETKPAVAPAALSVSALTTVADKAAPEPKKSMGGGVKVDQGIRVDTERLDAVLTLSGEIGLARNRISSLYSKVIAGDNSALVRLDEAINQMDILVTDLQSAATKTRMQPVGKLFQKYPRVVRDLSRQLGKDIELVILGEETEIDKSMIEDLSDPMIHLIRNAVDHGIDMPEDRVAQGKPAKGTISILAEQSGDNIIIKISDDGKGMSASMIRRKAVEKGLITESDASSLDDKQSINLIFLPGFSTKDQISDVSGRGVGMDVVKTNIHKLNGRIDVSSEPGKGSVFRIQLPLTLAIIPVLMARCNGQTFALPLSLVREIMQINPDKINMVGGRRTVTVRHEPLPIFGILEMLQGASNNCPHGVMISILERNFILGIDEFIGHSNVVVKPIDFASGKGVSGATITGDGEVVVVLDIEALLKDYIN